MTGLLDKWNLVKIAVADKNLNTAAKRVIVFLLDRENSKTGALFPSHLRISNDSNLHERSVRRGLQSLIDNGYLEILQKGSPGISTRYKIVMTKLSNKVDKVVQKRRRNCPTNPLTNPLSNPGKQSIKKIINNVGKNFNANYRLVKEGKKLKYNDPKMIAERIYKKTDNPLKAEAFLKLYNSFDEKQKKRAIDYARHLGCLK